MNDFEIERLEIIDKSQELLPPAWIPQNTANPKGLIKGSNRLTVTGPDGQLRKKLIELIQSCQQMVCISSFLLADREIIEAVIEISKTGRRAYILTASEVQLRNESKTDSEFDQSRLIEHLKILDSLAGKVLVRTGENFHSKFLLVDPTGNHPKGFLLTANLTSEALLRNVELGIELSPAEL